MLLVVWLLWFACLAVFFVLALAFAEDLQNKRGQDGQKSQNDLNEGHD